MRVTNQPNGIELIIAASAAVEEARRSVGECRTALNLAIEAEAKALKRLAELVAVGGCSDQTHGVPKTSPPPQTSELPKSVVDDPNVPKQWRVAFALLEQDRLDYQRTAERIWGPVTNKKEADDAKNRISSNLQTLRKLGVVETLGSNRYRVNRELLAKLSGIPVPPAEEASS